MNEAKLASTSVDTERVIRDLLDAFKSLKTAPAPAASLQAKEEEQPPSPAQSGDDASKEFAVAGLDVAEGSVDSRAEPDAPPAYSTELPGIEVGEPEQAAAFEVADHPETADDQNDAQSGQYGIIEAFCKDHRTVERLHVTREELQALADTSLLGTLACKQDVLFILRQTRAARKMQVSPRPAPVQGLGNDIEMSDLRWWAEHVRRESIARLDELNSSNDIDRGNPLNRPFALSLAVILITTAIAIGIEMC